MEGQLLSNILAGGTAGIVSLLLGAILAILRGWLVPGYIYQDAVKRLARYDDATFRLLNLTERLSKDGGA